MKGKLGLIVAAVVFGAGYYLPGAEAGLITIDITAEVEAVYDTAGHLEGQIGAGDIITGWYTYDSLIPDTNPLPFVGDYWQSNMACGIWLYVGGFDFRTDPSSMNFLIEIGNDSQSGDDYYVASYENLALSNGVAVEEISWHLGDSSGSALVSVDLPTTAPVLGDWDLNYMLITGGPRETEFALTAHVTSAVPEPATVALLALGGVVVSRVRPRKRN